MKYLKYKILAAAFLFTSSFATAQNNLFIDYPGKLGPAQEQVIQNVLRLESTKRVRVVKINHELFKSNLINLNFFGDAEEEVHKRSIGYTGIKFRTWTGNNDQTLGSAAFILNGNRISAHYTSINGNYEVSPLGKGIHMIFEHDNAKFEGCGMDGHFSDRRTNSSESQIKQDQNFSDDPLLQERAFNRSINTENDEDSRMAGNECYLRLVIGYTSAAKTNTATTYSRTMNEHVSLAVVDANMGHSNSGAEQRVELAYLYAATDNETSSAGTDVTALRATSDGKWDEIHTHRNNYDGDMCALITDGTYSGLCGLANGFDYTDATNFFQVSEYDCIVGNYTMAHEFGHCQGLRHDNDTTSTPFAEGHGYNQGAIFRTIMAVCCTPARVNYWSNPSVTYPGGGGAMGVAGVRDCKTSLDAGDNTIASHRTTPSVFTTSISVGADETLNMFALTQLNSSNDAPSGSIIQLRSKGRVVLQPGFHAKTGSKGKMHIVGSCMASYSRESAPVAEVASQKLEKESMFIFPNPSNGLSTIQVRSDSDQSVSLDLYNLQGQLVKEISQKHLIASGMHEFNIDVSDLESGTYIVRLALQNEVQIKRLLVQF